MGGRPTRAADDGRPLERPARSGAAGGEGDQPTRAAADERSPKPAAADDQRRSHPAGSRAGKRRKAARSDRQRQSGWSRPWAAFFAAVIILGGCAVALGFGVRLRAALERNAEKRMATSSTSVQVAVTNDLHRYTDAVRLAAAALSAFPEPTAAAFQRISQAVDGQELTAARSMTLVVPGGDDTQAVWRTRGARNFTIKPDKSLREHLYAVFAEPLGDNRAPPTGTDLAAAQPEVEVTRLAAAGRDVAISDAYVRRDDRAAGQDKPALDVAAPVTAGTTLIGYVVLTVGATEFVTTNLERAAGDLLDAQLLTRSGSGGLADVATVARGDGSGFRQASNFTAGQRQWVLRTSASYQTLLPNSGRTDMVVVIAGMTLAVMFGTLMYLQMSATARTEREITAEVAERLAARDAQGEQGRLRDALAAQEALLSGLLAHPGEETAEVELRPLIEEVLHAGDAPGHTIHDLPPVRADVSILRHLVDTMLADALSRTPPGQQPHLVIGAGGGRLLVENAGFVTSCPLPGVVHTDLTEATAG